VDEVWVVTTHDGENADIMGVYASPEAARAAMEKAPNMRVLETRGRVHGVPVDEQRLPHEWAEVEKRQVERLAADTGTER